MPQSAESGRGVPHMTIRIRDFGPVTDGQVDLKPLTILIGPNNTGKSYVAMLIHSILSSGERYGRPRRIRPSGASRPLRLYDEHVDELDRIVGQNAGLDPFDIPQPYTEKLFHSACELIRSTIKAALERNFGSGIGDLVRRGAVSTRLDIAGSQNFTIKLNSDLRLEPSSPFSAKYRIDRTAKLKRALSLLETRDGGDVITIAGKGPLSADYFAYAVLDDITRSILGRANLISNTSHYFPASRSGILQGYKALFVGIIQSTQFAGAEPINIPKMTGVMFDFVSNIIILPEDELDFSDMAERMEEDLLGGHIVMERRGKYDMPDIVYAAGAETFPLHATSSTISEIAPLSLYLKHMVRKGDLLIIEEPEAHLHPKNQVVLARYIVKMIRAGLRVVLTTHSEFLLEKLGKFVIASGVRPEIRGKILEADPDDYLCPEQVSTHAFRPDDDGNVRIHPLKHDEDLGISQEEFAEVNQKLYDELIELEENAGGT